MMQEEKSLKLSREQEAFDRAKQNLVRQRQLGTLQQLERELASREEAEDEEMSDERPRSDEEEAAILSRKREQEKREIERQIQEAKSTRMRPASVPERGPTFSLDTFQLQQEVEALKKKVEAATARCLLYTSDAADE